MGLSSDIRVFMGIKSLIIEILLNFISIQYSILFAIVCSPIAYLIYFKILSTAGAGNLLICTIVIPISPIIPNAIFIS